MISEPYSEEKWQRESDARTLSEAKQIVADKKRHTGAKKAAKSLAKKASEEAAAMSLVAKKKTTPKKKTSSKRRTGRGQTMAAMRKKLR